MADPPETRPQPQADSPSVPRTYRSLFLGLAAAWFVLDQVTKTWAENTLATRNIDIVGSFRLNLAYNTGSAFSFGGGLGPWIALLALVVVGVLVWQGRTVSTRLGAVAMGMIVGGALGNVADRAFRSDAGFMRGAVIDFFDLQWWPIFNVADIGIVVGGILLVVASFRAPEPAPPSDGADVSPSPPDGEVW